MVALTASQTIIYVIHAIHGIKNNFRKLIGTLHFPIAAWAGKAPKGWGTKSARPQTQPDGAAHECQTVRPENSKYH
jgi:hypothetical protein